MKKKAVEQLAEKRLRKVGALEEILRGRKREIASLKNEKKGLEQVIQMLGAIVLEGVEKTGRLEIKKEDITEGLRIGYKVTQTEESFIIEKVDDNA